MRCCTCWPIAGRLGIDLTLDDFDQAGHDVPLMVNLQPSGEFLMDDFYRAGGVLAALAQVKELFHSEAITVTGRPFVEYLTDRPCLRRHGDPAPPVAAHGGRRHRRAARQPGAARRHRQASRCHRGPAPARRPGGGLRQHRRHAGSPGRS